MIYVEDWDKIKEPTKNALKHYILDRKKKNQQKPTHTFQKDYVTKLHLSREEKMELKPDLRNTFSYKVH